MAEYYSMGGLLDPNQPMQNFDGSQAYIPGVGMPLYNTGGGQQSQQDPMADYYAALAKDAQNTLQNSIPGTPQYLAAQQTLQQYGGGGAGGSNDPLTVVGQGEAWLSPDELRAKTNALQSTARSGGSTGGSTGGITTPSSTSASSTGSSTGSRSLSGGLLSGSGANLSGMTGPNVGGFPSFQGGAGVSNYMPGGQPGQAPPPMGAPGGQVPMMQAGPQSGLNQFYNTPGYQLTEGQGAVNQFQASPGYQYAVDQALNQVQKNAASRGLLDSGAALRAMTDRAQNMANQEFGNWQNRQQQLYGNYQNRLAGLAGGPTGAEQAFQLGQGQGATAMQTGSNMASLLANQGSSLFGGITGTGAAQAQNVNNAGNMQAQILSGNMATQLAAGIAGGLFK